MKLLGKRAQAAMEYLFIVGFGFLLIIPIILLFYYESSTLDADVTAAQAHKVLQELVGAIDTVHYLGEPSKQKLKLRFPDHILSVTLNNNSIVMAIDGTSGTYELIGVADVNLTGAIDSFSGTHVLTVQAIGNEVNITEN